MPRSKASAEGDAPRELKLFAGLSLLFFGLSLMRSGIFSIRHGARSGFGPLWLGSPGFDFYDYMSRIKMLHTPAFFSLPGYPWYYAAPGAPLYAFFYLFCIGGSIRVGFTVFALIVCSLCLFTGRLIVKAMVGRGIRSAHAVAFIVIAGLTSWPILFSLQRGNLESVLWFGLALVVWAIAKGRWTLAAVALGIIGAVKIYPAICFALFLKRRKWKELCFGLCTMAAVTIASLRYINHDLLFALHGTITGMRRWTEDYATRGLNLQYDHSYFELVKVATLYLHLSEASLLRIYLPIFAVLMLAVFLMRVIRMPLANQLLFLTTSAVCLPPASFDYALQNMYVPFFWILLLVLEDPSQRRSWQLAVFPLFAVVFAPATFLVVHGYTFPGVAKGIALVGLVAISVTTPMHRHETMEASELHEASV